MGRWPRAGRRRGPRPEGAPGPWVARLVPAPQHQPGHHLHPCGSSVRTLPQGPGAGDFGSDPLTHRRKGSQQYMQE